jgi:hypothetical protein
MKFMMMWQWLQGSTAEVYLYGAHVTSWTVDGKVQQQLLTASIICACLTFEHGLSFNGRARDARYPALASACRRRS